MSAVTTIDEVEYKPDIDFSVFCSLEHMGILKEELMDQGFTSNYIDKITRNADGRYCTPIPWKSNKTRIETNRSLLAEARLKSLLSKLGRNPTAMSTYHEQIMEYVQYEFVTRVDPKYKGVHTYLPHQPVFREHAPSTQCRPVFDGSAHLKGRPSINEVFEVGPNLHPEILRVLL